MRFAIRRRAQGWAVVDTEGFRVDRMFDSEGAAVKAAAEEEGRVERTFAVVWHCEVDAIDAVEAEAKARKFLAANYRENWEPLSVDEVEVAPR